MKLRKNPGTAIALVLAGHPVKTLTVALGVALAAALMGRPAREIGLVALTVLLGRLTAGWLNDVADRNRDAKVGRQDKPIARGWIDPGTVTFSTAVVTCLVVPLSIANGTEAGVAHLLSVAAAWVYSFGFKRGALSWLPWAVSFGLFPAFLSYGGWGGGMHGSPPTIELTVLAALLGICMHFVDALPDLVEDDQNGLKSLPVRIGLKIGAARLLLVTGVATTLVVAGLVVAGLTVGISQ